MTQGLSPLAHFLATSIWFLAMYVIFIAVFVGFGAAVGLSIFTKTEGGVQVGVSLL